MIISEHLSKPEMRRRLWAAIATVIVAIIAISIKFWAYNVTSSQAIYSDALEGIVNILTAIIGVAVVYYASLPVDQDHPYGHGKVEYFSAAFEGGLIIFAAIFVFIGAIKAGIDGVQLKSIDKGLILISIAGAINFVFGLVLHRMGKAYASPTLQSAGTHLIVDFGTTLGAIAGVGLVKYTGLFWLDQAVAICLGIYMAYSGVKLVRTSLGGLLDAEDLIILKRLAVIFEKFSGEGIIQIHHTKVIRSGWFHHIDAHIVVPEFWSVEKAHERLDVFENEVIKTYEYGGEANFHLDPCRRRYCEVCDYPNCQVRTAPFKERMPVKLSHLRSKYEPNQKGS
jgi:cation diffusion facilitator family transporter